MTREDVIRGMECCMLSYKDDCDACPYLDKGMCQEHLGEDAIALLKAQEPVSIEERLVLDKLHTIQDYARVNEIHWMADGAAFAETVVNMLRGEINQLRKAQEPDATRLVRHYSKPNVYADLWLHCEKCGGRVDDRYKPKFCPECGRAVKWE